MSITATHIRRCTIEYRARSFGSGSLVLLSAAIPVAGEVVRRESDQREDGLRGAAFHCDESNRLKYNHIPERPNA